MSEPKIAYAPAHPTSSLRSSVAATLEVTLVIGVSLAGALLAMSVFKPGIAETLGLGGGRTDLLAASLAMLRQFAVQYGALLVLVVAIGLLRRRTTVCAYALGRGSLSGGEIIGYGILLGLVAGSPATALLMLQQYSPIGTDTPMWLVLRSAPKDLDYYLFLGVSSFVLVPLLEEITWRGYVLGRFSEALAPGAAVVATAIPFTLLHAQYASTDPAMILASLSTLVLSVAMGMATIRTATVWPAVIAHAIINSPVEGALGWIRVAATFLAVILFARPIISEVRRWAGILFRRDTAGAILPLLIISGAVLMLILVPAPYQWWFIGAAAVATVSLAATGRSEWSQ